MPLHFRSGILRRASLLLFLGFLTLGCGGGGGGGSDSPRLIWNAPDTYTDGNQIQPGDLKGYRIYYRIENCVYSVDNSYFVSVPATSETIPELNLRPGKYYFVVTAVDIMDAESDFSNEISRQIN